MRWMGRSGMVMAAALFAATASAATLHDAPSTSDLGKRLAVHGTVDSLGVGDVTVELTAVGTATLRCVDKKTGDVRSTPHSVHVTTRGVQRIPASTIRDRTIDFNVTSKDPRVSTRAAGCRGRHMRARLDDVEFQSATIRVRQNGTVLLTHAIPL